MAIEQINQANSMLDDALAAAQAGSDPALVTAIVGAKVIADQSLHQAKIRQQEAIAQATASGLSAFANVLPPVKTRSELEKTLLSLQAELKKAKDNKSKIDENHEDLSRKLGELSNQLAETKNEIDIAGGPFWFKRFHTSISIASAAAFLAIGNKVLTPGLKAETQTLTFYPILLFGLALILSGCIPVAFFLKKNPIGWGLSIIAAALFASGVLSCAVGAYILADLPNLLPS